MTAEYKLLFICSLNQWRSPTAEKVWQQHPNIEARSAGTSRHAKKTISPADIRWADAIIVMEVKHKQRIQASFKKLVQFKSIDVLDIKDNYHFMDGELIAILQQKQNLWLLNKDKLDFYPV